MFQGSGQGSLQWLESCNTQSNRDFLRRPKPSLPRATVVIVTKNRRDELCAAIRSALTQTVPTEVLVIDDGSNDGTSEAVNTKFPTARLIRHDESLGLVVRRNEAARVATGEIVFSIDDDAVFSSPRIVQQTLEEFNSARVAAIAIPYIDVNRDRRVRQSAPDNQCAYVTDQYIGTAHALRRDIFLRLGGYREHLVHQGEEGDFCARLLDAGYLVRLGGAEPIFHFESPKRDLRRMDFYGARNLVLFAWQNVPFPFLLAHLPMTMLRVLVLNDGRDRFRTRILGVMDGFRQCRERRRQPISSPTYRLVRRLRKRGATPLTELVDEAGH